LDFRPRLRRSQTQFPHDGADRGSVGPNAIPLPDRLNPPGPAGPAGAVLLAPLGAIALASVPSLSLTVARTVGLPLLSKTS